MGHDSHACATAHGAALYFLPGATGTSISPSGCSLNGREGWLLSHSIWRDEKSVVRWRTGEEHHQVQREGRFRIFQDYHLRVGDVISDNEPCAAAPVNNEGGFALTAGWHSAQAARSWRPKSLPDMESLRHRVIRVVRDYGMYDRREAPQYYDAVTTNTPRVTPGSAQLKSSREPHVGK